MLKSFGKAVVHSTYPVSPLYTEGLHKVSTFRSIGFLFALLFVCAGIESAVVANKLYQSETFHHVMGTFSEISAVLNDPKQSEIEIIIKSERQLVLDHDHVFDFTITVNEETPYTLKTERLYNLITFDPNLELISIMDRESERREICSETKSYFVFGRKSLLVCTEKEIDKLSDDSESSWIFEFTNIETQVNMDSEIVLPLKALPLLFDSIGADKIIMSIAAAGIFSVVIYTFGTLMFLIPLYFLLCIILGRVVKLWRGVGVSFLFTLRLIIHSATVPIILGSSSISVFAFLSQFWWPWAYALFVFLFTLISSPSRSPTGERQKRA
eukprot:TRINITY_DN6823_c0_g1_i1.p1 TRINITY_DN6823_c0_g1~~TRINITY_DN6823_c0_g1_i1.p1  ORF type:complete len:326 (+),score=49.03 TRINITY_DN6823_c0_g1_i1:44-1021(+)